MAHDLNEIKEKISNLYLENKFEEDLNNDSKTGDSKRKCLFLTYFLANAL